MGKAAVGGHTSGGTRVCPLCVRPGPRAPAPADRPCPHRKGVLSALPWWCPLLPPLLCPGPHLGAIPARSGGQLVAPPMLESSAHPFGAPFLHMPMVWPSALGTGTPVCASRRTGPDDRPQAASLGLRDPGSLWGPTHLAAPCPWGMQEGPCSSLCVVWVSSMVTREGVPSFPSSGVRRDLPMKWASRCPTLFLPLPISCHRPETVRSPGATLLRDLPRPGGYGGSFHDRWGSRRGQGRR